MLWWRVWPISWCLWTCVRLFLATRGIWPTNFDVLSTMNQNFWTLGSDILVLKLYFFLSITPSLGLIRYNIVLTIWREGGRREGGKKGGREREREGGGGRERVCLCVSWHIPNVWRRCNGYIKEFWSNAIGMLWTDKTHSLTNRETYQLKWNIIRSIYTWMSPDMLVTDRHYFVTVLHAHWGTYYQS